MTKQLTAPTEKIVTFTLVWSDQRYCVRCQQPLAYTYHRWGKKRQGYCANPKCANYALVAAMALKDKA